MKTILSITTIAALAASGSLCAQTAYSTPSGYTTQVLPASSFSFVGLTVHSTSVFSGSLDASSSNSVTDTGVNFTSVLTAGATYLLELENGTIQEITAWNASGALTTPENISAQISNGVTKYKLRKAATISDVFGANNSAGLTSSDAGYETADQIFLVSPNGTTIVYYYNDGSPDSGWYTSSGGSAANLPIVYADGFYVRRVAGSPVNLVVSGEVKIKPSTSILAPNWNYLSSVTPTGLTLNASGLQNHIHKSTDGNYLNADNIYIPTGGSFTIVYYFDDGSPDTGWYTSSGDPAGDLKLEGSFLLFNRVGGSKPYTISVPASFNTL